jgi:hypothetical protein
MGTSEKNSIFGEIYLFRDFLRQSLLPALFIPAPRSLYPCSPLSLSLLPALFIPAPRSPLLAPGSRASHIPLTGLMGSYSEISRDGSTWAQPPTPGEPRRTPFSSNSRTPPQIRPRDATSALVETHFPNPKALSQAWNAQAREPHIAWTHTLQYFSTHSPLQTPAICEGVVSTKPDPSCSHPPVARALAHLVSRSYILASSTHPRTPVHAARASRGAASRI